MSVSPTHNDELASKNQQACPTVQVLETVGTRWRLNILYALQDSELRFNELKRATGGRSKTVSDALDVLEEEGLVASRTERAAPIAVYYRLTEKGASLITQLDAIGDWAIEWMNDVDDPSEQSERLR